MRSAAAHPVARPAAPPATSLAALIALAGLAGAAHAQDSVASTPGGNDALNPFSETQQPRVRYVLDLVGLETAWDNRIAVGPVLKATRATSGSFNTRILNAVAASATRWTPQGGITPPNPSYTFWQQAGQGVSSANNAGGASTVNKALFDSQFCIAFADQGGPGTTAVGARIGLDADEPLRLYVERTTAGVSRLVANADDTCTISLGAVDERGGVHLRIDEFTAGPSFAVRVRGENLVIVDLGARVTSLADPKYLNFFANFFTPENTAFDPNATAFIVNNSNVTVNTPAGLFHGANPIVPRTLLGLDFRGRFIAGGNPVLTQTTSTDHRAAGVLGLRGNPSYSAAAPAGGTLGGVASPAIVQGERATAINTFGLNPAANPAFPPVVAPGSARVATLPANIAHPDGFSANATGLAEFHQWLDQVAFRGPSGQAGIGATPGGRLVLAATARDGQNEFIAKSVYDGASPTDPPTWSVVAYPGQPVRDGLADGNSNPAVLGALSAGAPTAISSPAVDALGNVYFTARWTPTGDEPRIGVFKAHPTPAGHQLELLLSEGEEIDGANSATSYIIESIALADADSIASSAFHQGSLVQSMLPGQETTDPASVFAMGGLALAATIAYQRAGGVEELYDAVLFVSPAEQAAPPCPGDVNGDLVIDFADLAVILDHFNSPGGPSDGDVNGDGQVDFGDLIFVTSAFNTACPQ